MSSLGDELIELIEELYPICRSITGDGVRRTLEILDRLVPLEVHEVPSGTEVLDWTVPDEWNITDAFIADRDDNRVVDFQRHNLHVINYSVPVDTHLDLADLRPHLHALPDQPDLIPYRTSYYDRTWGFCLTQHQLDALQPGSYHVRIDSTLSPGSLTYAEAVIPGLSPDEVLVSSHICHPSLANDNLSGAVVAAALARTLQTGDQPNLTYRFVFAPATIGAIVWLHHNPDAAARIRHGLTITCLGDDHPFTYKRTIGANATIDRAAAAVLAAHSPHHELIDFFPFGYDERQYNSPGFRIPVGSLMRGRHARFAEYHTSADNPTFVHADRLEEAHDLLRLILAAADRDQSYLNLAPYGEPQLGRRGLYRAIGGTDVPDLQFAMLWVLTLSDGDHSYLDIVERSGLGPDVIASAIDLLIKHELLDPC